MSGTKRIVVTGANGFIGRHVLSPLASRGYEVHAVSSKRVRRSDNGAIWHTADLLDRDAVAPLLDCVRPTHLLHLAWCTQPGTYAESAENYRWLEASTLLVEQFHDCGGRRMVGVGTCMEYERVDGLCNEFTTPCRPATVYGQCKLAFMEAMDAYCPEMALSAAWARVFLLYGPGEHPARLVASVINALLRGETASCNQGQLARDYLYVEDVAEALAAMVDSNVQGPVNIASGEPVTLAELVDTAAACLDARDRIHIREEPASASESPVFFGDTGRLRNEVGFAPRYSLSAGMAATVAWWKEHVRDIHEHAASALPDLHMSDTALRRAPTMRLNRANTP